MLPRSFSDDAAAARAGLIAVDEKTIDYVRGRAYAPSGDLFERAAAHWRTLVSDEGAEFDRVVAGRRRHSPTGDLGYLAGDGSSDRWAGARS